MRVDLGTSLFLFCFHKQDKRKQTIKIKETTRQSNHSALVIHTSSKSIHELNGSVDPLYLLSLPVSIANSRFLGPKPVKLLLKDYF